MEEEDQTTPRTLIQGFLDQASTDQTVRVTRRAREAKDSHGSTPESSKRAGGWPLEGDTAKRQRRAVTDHGDDEDGSKETPRTQMEAFLAGEKTMVAVSPSRQEAVNTSKSRTPRSRRSAGSLRRKAAVQSYIVQQEEERPTPRTAVEQFLQTQGDEQSMVMPPPASRGVRRDSRMGTSALETSADASKHSVHEDSYLYGSYLSDSTQHRTARTRQAAQGKKGKITISDFPQRNRAWSQQEGKVFAEVYSPSRDRRLQKRMQHKKPDAPHSFVESPPEREEISSVETTPATPTSSRNKFESSAHVSRRATSPSETVSSSKKVVTGDESDRNLSYIENLLSPRRNRKSQASPINQVVEAQYSLRETSMVSPTTNSRVGQQYPEVSPVSTSSGAQRRSPRTKSLTPPSSEPHRGQATPSVGQVSPGGERSDRSMSVAKTRMSQKRGSPAAVADVVPAVPREHAGQGMEVGAGNDAFSHTRQIEKNMAYLVDTISLRTTVLWDKIISWKIIGMPDAKYIQENNKGERDQVRQLLTSLCKGTKKNFIKFLQVLRATNHGHVADRLAGADDVQDEDGSSDAEAKEGQAQQDIGAAGDESISHSRIIEQNLADLVDTISLTHTTLWDKIISQEIINMSDVSYIKENHKGERDQVRQLLASLCKGPHGNFIKFLQALRATNQGHVADRLAGAGDVEDEDGSSDAEADKEQPQQGMEEDNIEEEEEEEEEDANEEEEDDSEADKGGIEEEQDVEEEVEDEVEEDEVAKEEEEEDSEAEGDFVEEKQNRDGNRETIPGRPQEQSMVNSRVHEGSATESKLQGMEEQAADTGEEEQEDQGDAAVAAAAEDSFGNRDQTEGLQHRKSQLIASASETMGADSVFESYSTLSFGGTPSGYQSLRTPAIGRLQHKGTPTLTIVGKSGQTQLGARHPGLGSAQPATVDSQKKKTTKKPAAAKGATKAPSAFIPKNVTKSIFTHFCRHRPNKAVIDEVEKVSQMFWKQATADLAAYANHAKRNTIDETDVELLMKRQRFVTDKQTMHGLVEKYLPLEYRQEIIPIARAGNRVEPKIKR